VNEDMKAKLAKLNELRAGGLEYETYQAEMEEAVDMLGGLLARVDMLHETITGNLEHAIGTWLDDMAQRTIERARKTENEAHYTVLAYAGYYLKNPAKEIKEGTWKK
jgi:hypothetical protein